MDIHIYSLSAKIARMSPRRQKRALKKRGPTHVVTGAYPISVGTMRLDADRAWIVEHTFSFTPTPPIPSITLNLPEHVA